MFQVGQLVKCIADGAPCACCGQPSGLERGRVYTVSRAMPWGRDFGVSVVEAATPPAHAPWGWLGSYYFRPLDDTALDIFRAVVTDAPKQNEPA